MTKLPKLPNPASVLEAKYTAEQMREYARKAVAAHQRDHVQFPTMLRRMWSGGDVQDWLDKHVNKGTA